LERGEGGKERPEFLDLFPNEEHS